MSADKILSFWFGEPLEMRKVWFAKDPAFDAEIRSRFLNTYEQAAADQLDAWSNSPKSCLALIIVLDQFPRNLFRGEARSFATDAKALKIAKSAIAQNFDQQVPPLQRFFFYLPLEHSENLDDQNESVRRFQAFENSPELRQTYDYAVRHRAVIQQFGRFPHRNRMLDRSSTSAEIEFLKQPGSSF